MVGIQRLERAHIEAMAPDVRVIGRVGVGVDTIDLNTVASLGITLLNEPNYGAVEVASRAVGLMIGLPRKMPLADRFVRAGWRGALPLLPMKPLDELTVGLVGCGRIGAETARMVHPLAAQVLAHDPYATTIPPQVTRVGGLDELLRRSDVLSVHVPLTAQTRGGSSGIGSCRCCPPAPSSSTSRAAGSSMSPPWPTCPARGTSAARGSMSSPPSRCRPRRRCSVPRTRSSPRTARRSPTARCGGWRAGRWEMSWRGYRLGRCCTAMSSSPVAASPACGRRRPPVTAQPGWRDLARRIR